MPCVWLSIALCSIMLLHSLHPSRLYDPLPVLPIESLFSYPCAPIRPRTRMRRRSRLLRKWTWPTRRSAMQCVTHPKATAKCHIKISRNWFARRTARNQRQQQCVRQPKTSKSRASRTFFCLGQKAQEPRLDKGEGAAVSCCN